MKPFCPLSASPTARTFRPLCLVLWISDIFGGSACPLFCGIDKRVPSRWETGNWRVGRRTSRFLIICLNFWQQISNGLARWSSRVVIAESVSISYNRWEPVIICETSINSRPWKQDDVSYRRFLLPSCFRRKIGALYLQKVTISRKRYDIRTDSIQIEHGIV